MAGRPHAPSSDGTGAVVPQLSCDLGQRSHQLRLIREIVALANTHGGRITIGVADDGGALGISTELRNKLDPADIADMVFEFTRPDRVEVTVETMALAPPEPTPAPAGDGSPEPAVDAAGDEATGDEADARGDEAEPAESANGHDDPALADAERRWRVDVVVDPWPQPPLVMAKAGTPEDGGAKSRAWFDANAVLVRRHQRVAPARHDDFRRWRSEAVDGVRQAIYERLAMVVEAPTDAHLRVVTETEVHDEPSYFLSRSADMFRVRAERLLTGQDLNYLWQHRATVRLDDAARELLVQSALRKRTTLWLWLAHLDLAPFIVRQYLERALSMSDRDKSDAAKAILEVTALHHGPETYQYFVDRLAESSYAHMREAAQSMVSRSATRSNLLSARDARRADQDLLVELSDVQLLDRVDELLAQDSSSKAVRSVPPLGLELLLRRLEHSSADVPSPTLP
ncbi:MAG: ATP-binding protein [Actinomycetota bacterium]